MQPTARGPHGFGNCCCSPRESRKLRANIVFGLEDGEPYPPNVDADFPPCGWHKQHKQNKETEATKLLLPPKRKETDAVHPKSDWLAVGLNQCGVADAAPP